MQPSSGTLSQRPWRRVWTAVKVEVTTAFTISPGVPASVQKDFNVQMASAGDDSAR